MDGATGGAKGVGFHRKYHEHGGGYLNSGEKWRRPGGTVRGGMRGEWTGEGVGIYRSKDGRRQGINRRESGRGSPKMFSRMIRGEEDEG